MTTAKDRMLAGEEYVVDAELIDEQRRAAQLMALFNAPGTSGSELKRLLTELLESVGEGVVVRPPLYVDYGAHLTIGTGTFVNFGLVALDCAPITIGADVQIGPNVQLLTPTHPVDPERRRAKWESARPITIGDNVWLGGGAIVLPGARIGADTVVGAGAVVTGSLPAAVVAVGNPARVVRRVNSMEDPTSTSR
ncbi:MAG: sugar O-acetyltransferase [Nocardioidaceae bacterium]